MTRKRRLTEDALDKTNSAELRLEISKLEPEKRKVDSDDDIIAQKKQGIALSDDSDKEFLSPMQTPDKRERERPSSLKLDIVEYA